MTFYALFLGLHNNRIKRLKQLSLVWAEITLNLKLLRPVMTFIFIYSALHVIILNQLKNI